jgi:hypothetical protein
MTKPRRNLAPRLFIGGFLIVLVCCGREPSANPEAARSPDLPDASTTFGPLPDSAFRVEWSRLEVPPTITAGKTTAVKVTFRNTSPNTWPDPRQGNPSQPDGSHAVRVSYRWWRRSAPVPVSNYDARIDLTAPLRPGQSTTLVFPVKAPSQPGDYSLQFDLVEELAAWFENKGAPKAMIPVKVS